MSNLQIGLWVTCFAIIIFHRPVVYAGIWIYCYIEYCCKCIHFYFFDDELVSLRKKIKRLNAEMKRRERLSPEDFEKLESEIAKRNLNK